MNWTADATEEQQEPSSLPDLAAEAVAAEHTAQPAAANVALHSSSFDTEALAELGANSSSSGECHQPDTRPAAGAEQQQAAVSSQDATTAAGKRPGRHQPQGQAARATGTFACCLLCGQPSTAKACAACGGGSSS